VKGHLPLEFQLVPGRTLEVPEEDNYAPGRMPQEEVVVEEVVAEGEQKDNSKVYVSDHRSCCPSGNRCLNSQSPY